MTVDQHDAETTAIEAERVGGPVDPPDRPATFAAVVSRADQRRPIVPASLRSPDGRAAMARWAAGYGAHVAAYHLTRSPKYTGKVAVWAPVGAVRTAGRVLRWATAEDGNWSLRQEAANRNDPKSWLLLDRTRERQSRWRWLVVLVGVVALGVAVGALLLAAPSWAPWVALAAALPALAWAGRPADRPILDRVTTGPRFVKLTADMVRAALCSIGVAAIKDPASLKFPQDIGRDGPGWLARVNLPAGVEAVDVLERRGRLSSALRLPVDQVWPTAGPEHAGQLDLWVGFLPASKMGQPAWSLAADSVRTSVFDPHEFGTDERQRPVPVTLFARNFLIGGVPGSGKSYGARTLATIAALDPTAELKIAEFKGTADFGDFAPLCSTYACGVDDAALAVGMGILTWGLAEAERRGERIRRARERGEAPEGKVTPELAARPGSGLHPVVIVIDEVHELFGDPIVGKEAAVAAERLIKRGRALGLVVVLATQIPDRSSLPPNITRCVTVRWCMAVQDQVANDMILGTGAYKRGLTATAYRPGADAGWGVATGLAAPTAVRSHFPDPATAAAIVARATALRGGVVGGPVDEAPRRDVLADVLRVFATAGRRALHWDGLAAQLAEAAPEYAGIGADAVSALVRDKGVPSESVKVDGVTRRGCKRAEIEAAITRREITD
jgi:S-DNA-T family DNA segregation ATPase FtsK/SpoIIIE